MTIGGDEIKNATSEKHAAELTEAHFIQSLCAIGRDYLDFYFLRIGSHLSEAQINGALRALSSAKDEGNLRFIGIAAETDPGVVLTLWQFHDAFEVALTPRNHRIREPFEMLEPFAQQRRVGLITSRPFNWGYGLPFVALPSVWRLRNLTQSFYGLTLAQAVLQDLAKNHPVLVGVRSAKEVQSALTACQTPAPAGIEAVLDLFKEAFDRDSDWAELAAHPAAHVREAVERRVHDLQRV
jgi:aryl-alcohol dehydrogenase-like predicted oxidoreductase